MSVFFKMLGESWLPLMLVAACAYMLGSLSFAIIVTRLMSKSDIRDSGSGNAGATNVLRSQGALPAILTTAGDLAKAIASVFAAWLILKTLGGSDDGSLQLVGRYLAGLFCVLGHLYPLYFGFRGGKGVLATFGVMLVLDWRAALICLALFILIVAITRFVSLGSILAAISLPVVTGLFSGLADSNPAWDTGFCVVMTTIIAFILVYKHRENIKRLMNGTEHKIGEKKED